MISRFYAGVMTGTSLDAADAVLCAEESPFASAAAASVPIPRSLAARLRAADENMPLAEAAEAANEVSHLCAKAFLALPQRGEIIALGCHGQTVLHNPERGQTMQLLNGALLAELTGANVVCDFRSRDIAAGGQGAPLAPLFHRAAFASFAPCAIINLGGIANITILDENCGARGWDIGPANMLMDEWTMRHRGEKFDEGGEWAKSGEVSPALLESLRAHPFLRLPPPKSCGREQFALKHFDALLSQSQHAPQNAQATLLEWSASIVAAAIDDSGASTAYLCGGGARNNFLRNRIAAQSAAVIGISDDIGIAADHVEPLAFAWLARQLMERKTAHLPPITGARGARLLGAIYPAGGE